MNSLPMRAASRGAERDERPRRRDGRDAKPQRGAQQRLVAAARGAHHGVLVLCDRAAHEERRRPPART